MATEQHPMTGRADFHSGIDISTSPGNPVKATADGIVSFAGWSGGSGNLVVLEHGHGFSTFYAHNRKLNVRVGQKVKRGDVIRMRDLQGILQALMSTMRYGRKVNRLTREDYLKGRA